MANASAAVDPVAHFEKMRAVLVRETRLKVCTFSILFILAFTFSYGIAEADPAILGKFIPGLVRYIDRTLPPIHITTFSADVSEWFWGFARWLRFLFETVLIAFLATLVASVAAFLMCFTASRNLIKSYYIYFISRRIFELARGVPELVYALIFVFAFGIGPVAGVFAIAVHSFGALGKMFSEINENVDLRSLEGVRATGGNWPQIMRYAVVPQVLPLFLSWTLLRFEINVRAASILGFVGAGGIGQELYFAIRQFLYTEISAIVILIMITVSIIDMTSERLRHRLIREGLAH